MLLKVIARTVLIFFLISILAVAPQASVKGSEAKNVLKHGADISFRSDPSPSENSSISESEWKMFQHDSAHSGYTRSRGPHTPNVLWKRELAINPHYSVVANRKVFVGSQNNVYCLDESSGDILWESSVYDWVFSLAEDENKIFVGSISSTRLILCCLDEADGRLLWSYNPSEENGHRVFEATPTSITLDGGKIYASAYVKDENRGHLICLNQTSQVLLWDFSLINETIRSSPTVQHDRVFVIGWGLDMINETFGINHSHLYCANATTGTLIWKLDLNLGYPPIVQFPVSIINEKVIIPFSDTKIVCVKAANGETVWQYEIPDINSPVSCFAVTHGNVFVGSYRCLDVLNDTDATLIWSVNGTETGIEFGWTVPLVAEDRLYFSTDYPQGIWCFNSTTGERLWNYLTVTKFIGTAGSGSLIEGNLFIPIFDGDESYLFCFEDQGEGVAVWPFVSDAHCDVKSTQTINFNVIWTSNGSNINDGSIFVNGSEYAIGSPGRASFNHTSDDVTKISWIVTAVNCTGINRYFQMSPIAEIVWDTIIIFDKGSSASDISIGESVTVWFKAEYEYNNESFSGLLWINGSAASYSDANKRWEYQYTATNPGTVTFEVTGVSDRKYGLKTLNNVIGFQQVNVHGAFPWWIPEVVGIVGIAIAIGYVLKKRRTRASSSAQRSLHSLKKPMNIHKSPAYKNALAVDRSITYIQNRVDVCSRNSIEKETHLDFRSILEAYLQHILDRGRVIPGTQTESCGQDAGIFKEAASAKHSPAASPKPQPHRSILRQNQPFQAQSATTQSSPSTSSQHNRKISSAEAYASK